MKKEILSIFIGLILTMTFGIEFVNAQKTTWKVENSGAMREMFATGNIEGKIEIEKITPQKNLYAVGPLANLSGEIMIWNGVPLISFMKDNKVVVEKNPKATAVFFVWGNVAKWQEISIPQTIKTYDELEKFIAEAAEKSDLNSAEPFPFQLKGTFSRVDWHVNNYNPDGTKLTHEKHDLMKYKGIAENAKLEMIGFYSPKHQGVFTHHTRTSHVHAADKKRTFIGHVDDLQLNGNVKLLLPKK